MAGTAAPITSVPVAISDGGQVIKKQKHFSKKVL
jgi:hypothetical protein